MTKRVAVIKAVRVPIPAAEVRAAIEAAAGNPSIAASLPRADWSLALRLSGDGELRRLNRQYLGEDHATDVLSFPSGDADGYLGDIVISWPATQRQGEEFGHGAAVELALLSVHGFLHLLGFDHGEVREENAMNRLTVMALAELGLRIAPGRLTEAGA